MPFQAVLIDLDGTLLDTIADIADATNAMLIELDRPALAQDVIRTYVGKGTRHLVRRALATTSNSRLSEPDAGEPAEPDLVEQGLALFSHHYGLVNGDKSVLYPGALEGLKAFKKQGLKLAVVTNKSTEFTGPLLTRTGIAGFFDQVVCGDTCAERKPHPMPLLHACKLLGVEPTQALAIGDSVNDTQAARAAEITVLAVPYGYNEGLDVRALEVDDIVMSIEAAAQWAAQYERTS